MFVIDTSMNCDVKARISHFIVRKLLLYNNLTTLVYLKRGMYYLNDFNLTKINYLSGIALKGT